MTAWRVLDRENETMSLRPGTQGTQTADRRRWPRYRVHGPVPAILTADGRTQRCLIEEVSAAGARIRVAGAVPRNLEVRLEHPAAGYIYATRVWAAPNAMGLEFRVSVRSLRLFGGCLDSAAGLEGPAQGRTAGHAGGPGGSGQLR